MHSSFASASLIGLSCLSALSSASPFSFANNPLGNGFPTPNPQQLMAIEAQAHGSLPNGPSPSAVKNNTVTSLELIAFNEIFETAFFSSVINNITNNVQGFAIPNGTYKDAVLEGLTAIRAQEELHTLFANTSLSALGARPVQPCQYMFPTTSLTEAVALASTFTDIVLGALPNIQALLAMAGPMDAALIPGVGSVIAQEGEQNGVYRILQKKVPSTLPFLTAGTREFAFSALNQMFIVPGSCETSYINLPIFEPLTVATSPIEAKAQSLSFSFPMPADGSSPNFAELSVAYVNQQNVPIVEKLQDITICETNLTVEFTAMFPYNGTTFGNGLTYALVTEGPTNFTSADDVAKATKYGPGLVEIE